MVQEKQTILFILPWLPYPLCSGGHQGIFNGIRAVRNDFNIVVSYPEKFEINSEEERAAFIKEMGGDITICPYKLPPEPPAPKIKLKTRIHRWLRRLYSHPQPQAKSNPEYYEWPFHLLPINKSYTQHILHLINRYKVTIIQCEMLENAPFIYILPENLIRIFVHHELRFVRQALMINEEVENPSEMLAYQRNAMATEIGTLNFFDAVITVSQTDAEKLVQAGVHTPVYPSLSIVSSPVIPPLSSINTQKLSFIGPSSHKPNLLGIQWFLDNCWIYLSQKGYHLQIIGNWDESVQNKIAQKYPNITFRGFVKDIATVIHGTVMIVPVNIGSGIRMKILEASAAGIPIVSTSVGVEGIPYTDNIHCLIADSPENFIEAIEKLHDDALCSRLIENSQTVVKKYYSLDALRENRLSIYNQLLKQKKSSICPSA